MGFAVGTDGVEKTSSDLMLYFRRFSRMCREAESRSRNRAGCSSRLTNTKDKTVKLTQAKKILLIALGCASAVTLWAFNPQPDPPGFGLISLADNEVMRLNVVCHNPPGYLPSGERNACTVNIGFMGADGRMLKYMLKTIQPNAADFIEITRSDLRALGLTGGRIGIAPCVLPDTGSRVIPTVEVYDLYTNKTNYVVNAAAPRLSFFSNGL
jgi:hypothetical protein